MAVQLLDDLRPQAFAIAYRMLGSVAEAEDVVQEALLRLHRVLESGEEIEVPEAYLATVVTRLGIDRLRSAQMRRETYVGEWLPEPVVDRRAGRPGRARRDVGLAVARLPRAARAPVARAARRVPAAGGVRLRLRRDRRDRRQERGGVPAAGRAGPPAHRAGPAAVRGLAPGARRAGTEVHHGRADGRPRRARGVAGPRRGPARRRRRQGAGDRAPAVRTPPRGADAARAGCGSSTASKAPRSDRSR